MDTRHLVDAELRPLLDLVPTGVLSAETLPIVRGRRLPRPAVAPSDVRLEVLSVPGPGNAPPIGLRVYRPAGADAPTGCIYHIHGGGFVTGSAEELEGVHKPLVEALGCAIVSVDYRLAPETKFPGAIEDCYAGLAWTFANAERLGIDPARIGVMGESAGGGLAAALALLARDRGEYALAFQHLIYPMLDDRTCTAADPHPHAGEFIWPLASNVYAWGALLGTHAGGEGVSPYAAPARAADLAGLPPTFISTGALDLFVEEDIEYARRLMRAGVPVDLHVYAGAFHAFTLAPNAFVAEAARRDTREALRRALG